MHGFSIEPMPRLEGVSRASCTIYIHFNNNRTCQHVLRNFVCVFTLFSIRIFIVNWNCARSCEFVGVSSEICCHVRMFFCRFCCFVETIFKSSDFTWVRVLFDGDIGNPNANDSLSQRSELDSWLFVCLYYDKSTLSQNKMWLQMKIILGWTLHKQDYLAYNISVKYLECAFKLISYSIPDKSDHK